ncbi:hypothetical protein Y032_0081g1488 [Ancylostoma ceylanicum]|uniref:TAZ-type domain-containing protein n=1 Tax=Ancylostoma ceylanicum TaxID=53326 RepID=A0A016TSN4_9BILA|nr:hypothetical protein Y032_0081g1488 [Ancylostoma ceylanicum]
MAPGETMADLEQFGSKEELRDHLGDLIHALRSHNPCTNLRRGDPLWCRKTSCVRPGILWCHMHRCSSEEACYGDLFTLLIQNFCRLFPRADCKCLYSRHIIAHWMNCQDKDCFVCGPWIRPTMLEEQPKKFLDEVFGTSTSALVRGQHSKTANKAAEDSHNHFIPMSINEDERDLTVSDFEEEMELLRLALGEINSDLMQPPPEKVEKVMDPIAAPTKCTCSKENAARDKPGPSGYCGPYIRPVFMGSSCCEAV